MALVWASQSLVLEGYAYFKERAHLFGRANYVKKSIYAFRWYNQKAGEKNLKVGVPIANIANQMKCMNIQQERSLNWKLNTLETGRYKR